MSCQVILVWTDYYYVVGSLFVPPIVMSGAFVALRIVWLRSENFLLGVQFGFYSSGLPFRGAPVLRYYCIYVSDLI